MEQGQGRRALDEATPGGPCVLLVDGDLDQLYLLSRTLRQSLPDVRVLLARSGPQALNLVEQDSPTVVSADLSMAGMNGLEFLGRVQATHPQTMRVLHTGLRDGQRVALAQREAGALVAFKGEDRSQFVEAIRGLLAAQR